MTKTVTRYECTCQEGHMAEEADGGWVRYDDIKHLLQAEPKAEPQHPLAGAQWTREQVDAINRLSAQQNAMNAARGWCQLHRVPACSEYPRCQCGQSALNRPAEPPAKLTLFEAQNTMCASCGLTLYACQCPPENREAPQ